VVRPDFNRSLVMDFQGAKLTSDAGFLLIREIDQRVGSMAGLEECLEDFRAPAHIRHSLVQLVRQRVYQMAAGYEDCNSVIHRFKSGRHLQRFQGVGQKGRPLLS